MNNRIQFGEPIRPEIPEEELPPEFLLTGDARKWDSASFRVYMVQSVYDAIWAHISETPNIESGGVLVGHPFRTVDGMTTFVVIVAEIPQYSQDRGIGHFTVGPVQIAEARREMEQRYPGLIAVGWYHSHPGHGVFLSSQDMTIVNSIYDAPWHIAMVIDPLRRKEGIFVGPEGRQIEGHGDRPRRVSWISLRVEPDSTKAMALYNQVRDLLQERRPGIARDKLNELQKLVEESPQLRHWRGRAGYRDFAAFQSEIDNLSSQQRLPPPSEQTKSLPAEPYEVRSELPRPRPPEPVRKEQRWLPVHWLRLSVALTIGFAAFVLVMALWTQKWSHWVTVGWGVLLSLLATILAGYVVFSREETESTHSNVSKMAMRPLHFAGERIVALFLISLVLILWLIYSISTKLILPISPLGSPETPTVASQTPIPTANLTPSPTPTHTATPIATP